MIHVKYNLPTHSPYYGFMRNGEKTFDIRLESMYKSMMRGDHIRFWEQNPKDGTNTGDWFIAKVVYIMRSKDLDFWDWMIDKLVAADLIIFGITIVETS